MTDLTEDTVVDGLCEWLVSEGWEVLSSRHATAPGDDVHAKKGDIEIFIECKGAVSKNGRTLDHWKCAAHAVFNAIRDAECFRPDHLHGVAIPDSEKYRNLVGLLRSFFARENIAIFWVRSAKEVEVWWPTDL